MVAIIAILAGMLLPALNQARERAKAIKCTGNAKQFAMVNIQYTNDNKGYLPYREKANETWQTLSSYLAYPFTTGTPGVKQHEGPIVFCPSFFKNPHPEADSPTGEIYYVWPRHDGYWGNGLVNVRKLRFASRKIMLAEVGRGEGGIAVINFYEQKKLVFPHANQQNVSFMDGHVKAIKYLTEPYFYETRSTATNKLACTVWDYDDCF